MQSVESEFDFVFGGSSGSDGRDESVIVRKGTVDKNIKAFTAASGEEGRERQRVQRRCRDRKKEQKAKKVKPRISFKWDSSAERKHVHVVRDDCGSSPQ